MHDNRTGSGHFSRRDFFRCAGAAGLGAFALPRFAGAQEGAARRPNILLIYVDDMGYGDLSCYNKDAWIKTPAIDKLAADGVRFTQGYVTAPVCFPSRSGLMTGAYQQRWGNYHNDQASVMPPDTQTLMPSALKAAGYTTGMAGKWNGVGGDPEQFFDETHHATKWGSNYFSVGRHSPLNWGPEKPGDPYTTDLLTDAACDFITRRKDETFFFYLAYHAPHSPLRAKAEHREQVAHLETEPQRVYAAMCLAIEEGVARVMKTLEDNGLARDTMVVFVSDNGPARGSSRLRGYKKDWPEMRLGHTGPLSGGKKTLREGGIRMPFIMSYPARLKKGVADDFVVSTLDLYPTFCALAGVKPPEGNAVDGINLMPHLEGRMAGPRSGNLYWALGRGRINDGAVRGGDWKLHVEHERDYTKMDIEALYNLAEDIGEQTDVAAAHPDVTARLLADYQEWLGRMGPPAFKR